MNFSWQETTEIQSLGGRWGQYSMNIHPQSEKPLVAPFNMLLSEAEGSISELIRNSGKNQVNTRFDPIHRAGLERSFRKFAARKDLVKLSFAESQPVAAVLLGRHRTRFRKKGFLCALCVLSEAGG